MEKFPGRNNEKTPNGPLPTYDEKINMLNAIMGRSQPTFTDFKGSDGFPNGMLRKDEETLYKILDSFADKDDKNMGASADDRFGRECETVLAYALNENIFTAGETRAILASDFDDKCNQTDVALRVNANGEDMVFAIQVATTTNPEKTKKKFDRSANGRGSSPMTKYIKYCKFDDDLFRAPESPHYIIGLSPAGLVKAVDKFDIEHGNNINRDTDLTTDFKILSELYEQTMMQLTILKRNTNPDEKTTEQIKKNQTLKALSMVGLCRVLGFNKVTKENLTAALNEKYPLAVANMKKEDAVYKNIVDEAIKRRKTNTGKKVISAMKA